MVNVSPLIKPHSLSRIILILSQTRKQKQREDQKNEWKSRESEGKFITQR